MGAITEAQLQKWRRRLEEIDVERTTLLRRIETVEEIFAAEAAERRKPAGDLEKDNAPQEEVELPPDFMDVMRLSDALVAVARKFRKPMTTSQYMRLLKEVGFKRPVKYQNTYNSLTRLKERGVMLRTEDTKFYLAPST